MNSVTTTSSSARNTEEYLGENEWEEDDEEETEPVEITINDEVIRVARPPSIGKPDVETKTTAVVGPEIVRPFPLNFKFTISTNAKLEKMAELPTDVSMRKVANLLEITDIARNKYCYWLVDVALEAILTIQNQEMNEINQVTTLNWFLFTLKQIQLTTFSRREFFQSLERMLLTAEKVMVSSGSEIIPNPTDIFDVNEVERLFGHFSQVSDEGAPAAKRLSSIFKLQNEQKNQPRTPDKVESKAMNSNKKTTVRKEKTYEDEIEGELISPLPPVITEKDLICLTDVLYDICSYSFADRLAYEILRDVFWEEPLVEVIRISERILAPKILTPEEVEATELPIEGDVPPALKPDEAPVNPITIEELLQPGELLNDLTIEEKQQRVLTAELQRSNDRYLLPLADAIDSAYFRKIYHDVSGISKFVFVRRKNMKEFRAALMKESMRAKTPPKKGGKRGANARRKSSRRGSKKRHSSAGRKSSAGKSKPRESKSGRKSRMK